MADSSFDGPFTFAFGVCVMAFGAVLTSCLMLAKAIRHPRRGAYQRLLPCFVQEAREMARDRRRGPQEQTNNPPPAETEESEGEEQVRTDSGYGTFDEFGHIHTTAFTEVDVDEPDLEATIVLQQPTRSGTSEWRQDYFFVQDLQIKDDSTVRLVSSAETGKLLVVKSVSCDRIDGTVYTPKEAMILRDIIKPHTNLVQMFALEFDDASEHSGPMCAMTLEHCNGGDLGQFLDNWVSLYSDNTAIPEILVSHIIAGLSDACAFLHLGYNQYGPGEDDYTIAQDWTSVVHCDIKPPQILLSYDGSCRAGLPRIVLCDFDIARFEGDPGVGGTLEYWPPEMQNALNLIDGDFTRLNEICEKRVLTTASDIYSLGVTLFELMTFRLYERGDKITNYRDPANHRVQIIATLINSCLPHVPAHRTTALEIFRCAPYFRNRVAELAGEREARGDLPEWDLRTTQVPAAAAPEEGVVADHTDMSQVDGFSDVFCMCPNHKSLSLRRPKPDCPPL